MAEEKTFSVGVQTSSPKRISVTSNVSENPITASADTGLYYSQLAKNWAIGEGLIQNEDYSSKTWAGESKSSADLSKLYSEAASLDLNNLENKIIEYDEQLNTTITDGLDSINTSITEGVETIETLQSNSIAEITTNKESALSDITTASNLGLSNITTAEANVLANIDTSKLNTLAQIEELANSSIEDINATGIDTKVSKSGDTMTGVLKFKNASSDKIRMTQGDYTAILHQNGESLFFLLTNKGDQDGQFNDLRPFSIKLADGRLRGEHTLSMPSNNYINLTFGANGSNYTAPANGYFVASGNAGESNGYVDMRNTSAGSIGVLCSSGTSTHGLRSFVPVKKGDNIIINYSSKFGSSSKSLLFVFAEGSV